MLVKAVLNHLIQQNVEIQQQLTAYAGRRVAMKWPFIEWDGVVTDTGFLEEASELPETTLWFQDSAVRKLLAGTTPGVGDVVVKGDHALGMALLPLLGGLRYDLSDDVARVFGDAAAAWVIQGVNQCKAEGTDWGRSVARQVADYGREQDAWVVGKEQFAGFSKEVNILRDDVARLTQRIQHLQKITTL